MLLWSWEELFLSCNERQWRLQVRDRLGKLQLNDAAVWEREHQRSISDQAVTSPWWIKGAYLALCIGLDVIYAKRPIQRFWFLETVARMPYFSYISMLHLYESLGWWRAGAELRKVCGRSQYLPCGFMCTACFWMVRGAAAGAGAGAGTLPSFQAGFTVTVDKLNLVLQQMKAAEIELASVRL